MCSVDVPGAYLLCFLPHIVQRDGTVFFRNVAIYIETHMCGGQCIALDDVSDAAPLEVPPQSCGQ